MRKQPLDPTIADEIRHDRMQEAQTMNYERCLVRAREMFAMGELTDQIRDLVADDPIDATNIALRVCYGNHFFYPRINVDAFEATVEGIIEKQAQRLLEDL
jgi:hypothetical protein